VAGPSQVVSTRRAGGVSARRAALDETRVEAAACRRCELWARATQTVFGAGPVEAPLMLVGEQPGDREDVEGEPFVGPAGRVLSEALETAGIERERVFVTNVVKHFRWRPSGKRRLHERPTRANIAACRHWIDLELDLVRPDVLVLLGATATEALLGGGVSVTRDRGRPIESSLAPTVLVTVHPSSILRSRGDRDAALAGLAADLMTARAAMDGGAGLPR
jgi:uracil-DNA glycosylase family protein